MAAGPSETPYSIGIGLEHLYDILQPRYVGVTWGEQAVQSEAIIIATTLDSAVFLFPAAAAPGAAQVQLAVEGEDGSEDGTLVAGAYVALSYGVFELGGIGAGAWQFHPAGLGPSLDQAAMHVPIHMLPEDLQEVIYGLPFQEAEDGLELEEGELDAGAAAQAQAGTAPPLMGNLWGPAPGLGSLLLGGGFQPVPPAAAQLPGAGRGAGLRAPALWGALPPGIPPQGDLGYGRGVPPQGGSAQQMMPGQALPAAGRGRGGRRAGELKAGGAPRISLATLSVQLASMAASAEQRADYMEQRLVALEVESRTPPAALGAPPPAQAACGLAQAPRVPPLIGTLPKFGGLAQAPPAVGAAPPGLRMGMPPAAPNRMGGYAPGAAAVPAAPPERQPQQGASNALTDTRAMAMAMAEQARAMATMASTYAGQEGEDDLLGGTGPFQRPARGAAALHRWRRALTDKPQSITARIRQNRNRAMTGLSITPDLAPSMRGYFGNEVPFGHARTAAYQTFGLCDIADLMEHGRWHEAEALTMLLLAATEQAALQEWNWGLAWLLTFSSEPPWTRIRGQAPSGADMRSVGRLADPELLAAGVQHMKDMIAIGEAQRRTTPAWSGGQARAAAQGDASQGAKAGGGNRRRGGAQQPSPGGAAPKAAA
jgi:hypothetical protein